MKAVVFDMDGLLADTEPLSFRAWAKLLQNEWGVRTTEEDERWSAVMVGRAGIEVWRMIGERFNLPFRLPDDVPDLEARFRQNYHDILAAGVPPMPGALDLVDACANAGLLLAVASSSAMVDIQRVLTGLGILARFRALASGSEVARAKPDPGVYLLACKRLGVAPAEAVALEDSGPGVQAARAAGLRCLAVPSSFTLTHDFSTANGHRQSLLGLTPADLDALPY